MIDNNNRKAIKPGMLVDIIADEDRSSGELTRGYVLRLLSQANHDKGVKVELTSHKQGRVQHVPTKDEIRLENFKFYNKFFYLPYLYTVRDEANNRFLTIPLQNGSTGATENIVFLFDSEESAKAFLKGTKFDAPKLYPIRRIHRKKPIASWFEGVTVDYFRINGERKLSLERCKEWEYKFKQMN